MNSDGLKLEEAVISEALSHLVTVRDFVRFAVSSMRQYDVALGQGTQDYFAEAAALVMQVLHLDWSISPEILDSVLLPSEKQQVLDLLRQRVNDKKPLAYLLNLSYFAGLPFYVDERVLIPRSPIAELIEAKFFPYFADDNTAIAMPDVVPVNDNATRWDFALPNDYSCPLPMRILDMCTGSGCIAIALAHAFDEAIVDAVDLSADALEVAAVNVEHHQLLEQVSLIESDLFAKVPPTSITGGYDLIVCNPPYVDSQDMADLPAEFNHEPELALAAGQDGLDLVKVILAQAADYLSENGLLVVEVGNSAWALKQTFPEVAFYWLQFAKGGDGVFALTASQCRAHHATFAAAISG